MDDDMSRRKKVEESIKFLEYIIEHAKTTEDIEFFTILLFDLQNISPSR